MHGICCRVGTGRPSRVGHSDAAHGAALPHLAPGICQGHVGEMKCLRCLQYVFLPCHIPAWPMKVSLLLPGRVLAPQMCHTQSLWRRQQYSCSCLQVLAHTVSGKVARSRCLARLSKRLYVPALDATFIAPLAVLQVLAHTVTGKVARSRCLVRLTEVQPEDAAELCQQDDDDAAGGDLLRLSFETRKICIILHRSSRGAAGECRGAVQAERWP